MNPVIARARTRLVVALAALAVLAPAALAAAQYPRYWEWIALELTPMTWLQTVLLVLSAATSAVIAVIGKVHGWSRALRIPHWLLAAGFAYLALDDRFAIHERIRDRILAPRDISIPGLSFLAPGDFQVLLMGIAGLIVLPFVLRALRRDRLALWLFVLGVVCSVTSIGMDAIDPATMPVDVERLEQTLEECVELLAAAFYVAALGVRLLGLLDPATSTATSSATSTQMAAQTPEYAAVPAAVGTVPAAAGPGPDSRMPTGHGPRRGPGEDGVDAPQAERTEELLTTRAGRP